jgi:hypothetical protein
MSLKTAITQFVDTLVWTDPDPDYVPPFDEKPYVGIPENWQSTFGKLFLDVLNIQPSFGALQAVIRTAESANAVLFFSLHSVESVPVGKTFFYYRFELVEAIIQKIMQNTDNGVYQSDGGSGFRVDVQAATFDYGDQEPVCYCRISLVFSQYNSN